ncbi:MAG: CHASE2 domain-containing protein [Cyanobacteria bacterium P01_A01_bin.84]
MNKLVIIKIGEGNFESGFAVTLAIGVEGKLPEVEITGKLAPLPEMPLYYSHWQSSYRRLGQAYRLGAHRVQVTNVSVTHECVSSARILRSRFNSWLQDEGFRPLREKWLEKLLPTDIIRVILQTEDSQLQRLPWHSWDLLERYPQAEISLASPSYERIQLFYQPNSQVNILAIVGNSQGIDTEADQVLLQGLPDANVTFLVEPQRQQLTESLWNHEWDILFFAGHSSSSENDASGLIYLNQTDSLTIGELQYALRKAVKKGLQLAIFNSCDGLGLARELTSLHIPQMIVMREPVPDLVAQQFLKYFLQDFSSGESFYQSVRSSRERLQGLEDKYPCATWLPVICQNPAQTPLKWSDFIDTPVQDITDSPPLVKPELEKKLSLNKLSLNKILISSVVMTAVVSGIRFIGLLQNWELSAFDYMMRSRSLFIDEGVDSRLLIVTIDDADLNLQRRKGENLKGTSISDNYLNQLIEKLQASQPKFIGLDIYRDFPAELPKLKTTLQNSNNIIGVCKGGDSNSIVNTNGIAPPPELPLDNIGFSDFILDSDQVVRRHLLYMNSEVASLCRSQYALSLELAFRYLHLQSTYPTFNSENNLQIGKTVIPAIHSYTGGYQNIDANGGQILLNYRITKQIAPIVTLRQILDGEVDAKYIKNRIVLVGISSKGDLPDYWATPYGKQLDKNMPGVIIHAHMTSQILSTVLNNRPLLKVWSSPIEIIWIFIWSMIGAISAWFGRKQISILILVTSISAVILYLLAQVLLIQAYWVPFIPSVLVLLGTIAGVYLWAKK